MVIQVQGLPGHQVYEFLGQRLVILIRRNVWPATQAKLHNQACQVMHRGTPELITSPHPTSCDRAIFQL
ncbi:hypothetical protein KSP39_PZI005179 [Platanthera zijinensis]|uniref:Uncharacterized protein n=1 Tax=Platanthera zijinensis TaxID=2320716 RepID=A0AAP0BR71_9ASPA